MMREWGGRCGGLGQMESYLGVRVQYSLVRDSLREELCRGNCNCKELLYRVRRHCLYFLFFYLLYFPEGQQHAERGTEAKEICDVKVERRRSAQVCVRV